MITKDILSLVIRKMRHSVQQDREDIFHLLYYSVIEAVLFMIVPLTSIFIVNSVLAHAEVSIFSLSIVVIVIFSMVTILQIIKKYMIEKFEQKIFVKNAIEVADFLVRTKEETDNQKIDKYMNYFFDVISIQKIFPILLLDGAALVIKVIVSLVLLFIFDISIFSLAILFLLFYIFIVLYLGRDAPHVAIDKSDAKHEAIYYLQTIALQDIPQDQKLRKLDALLVNFVKERSQMYKIIVKQLALTYITEGLILSTFFIYGGYLVYEGVIPIGEFVAIEIIIISITSALKEFIKNLDYIYEIIEGFYKLDKLTKMLGSEQK